MMNKNEFQFQIDGILKEARNSSVITICCMKAKASKASGKKNEITVLSVNGFSDPLEFKKSLRLLALKIEEDTMQRQAGLAQFLRPQLLDEVSQAITNMMESTIRLIPDENGISGKDQTESAWEFIGANIRVGSKRAMDPTAIKTINDSVKEFAHAYRLIFGRLLSKLGILSMMVQYVRTEAQGNPSQNEGKIVIETTVAKFAALNRIFYERGMFGECNKTELCPLLSSFYCLSSRDSISSNSFRNHFCTPTSESLAFWQDTFKEINGVIKELWEKYHNS